MKKYLILLLVPLLGWSMTAGAQRLGVREEVRADWNKSSGLDCVYDLSPKASTPVPKGYEAVYISHYGRHGSRYAYTSDAYTVILNMLSEGRKQGNLTPKGEALLNELRNWDSFPGTVFPAHATLMSRATDRGKAMCSAGPNPPPLSMPTRYWEPDATAIPVL